MRKSLLMASVALALQQMQVKPQPPVSLSGLSVGKGQRLKDLIDLNPEISPEIIQNLLDTKIKQGKVIVYEDEIYGQKIQYYFLQP